MTDDKLIDFKGTPIFVTTDKPFNKNDSSIYLIDPNALQLKTITSIKPEKHVVITGVEI